MPIMKFTGSVLKNLFSKPATAMYPFVKKEFPKATRGHIENDINQCIFCRICSNKCPTSTIIVDRANKTWQINRMGCIQCGECVASCPKKCLSMENSYTAPSSIADIQIMTPSIQEEKKEA